MRQGTVKNALAAAAGGLMLTLASPGANAHAVEPHDRSGRGNQNRVDIEVDDGPGGVNGPHSPFVYFECLPRDTLVDVEAAGATEWEVLAVRVITRDGLSKGPVDVVETDCGAHGWAHFSPGRLDLNLTSAQECPVLDQSWRDAVLAVLYSDQAGALQLRSWRRIVGPAVREARSRGWRRSELALAAAVGNSSPRLLISLGNQCDWSADCVASRYARGSDHRERRITWLAQVSRRFRHVVN